MDFQTLNTVPACDFCSLLSDVFGLAPWVPERVIDERPFKSVRSLHQMMSRAVASAGPREQQQLLKDQRPLDRHRPFRNDIAPAFDEGGLQGFRRECAHYEDKFGFPFIMALEGHDVDAVQAELAERLQADHEIERVEALRQLSEIARYRLEQMFAEPTANDEI